MTEVPELKRRPTQFDIARMAGVSQATVSNVINGRQDRGIAPQTRQRVLQAIADCSYVTNPAARALSGGKNRLIGLFTFEPVFPVATQDFYYPFLVGVERAAEEHGQDLVLFTSASGTDRGRSIFHDGANRLRMADGCVLIGHRHSRMELQRLREENFSFVTIGRRETEQGGISFVAADYERATSHVVERLLQHDHERIGLLVQRGHQEPARDREAGYRSAMPSLEENWVMWRDPDRDPVSDLTKWIGSNGLTAVAVDGTDDGSLVADLTAAADAAALEIPADLSVGVLGDWSVHTSMADRDWSGFRIRREEMGWTAVVTLLDILSGKASVPQEITLPCEVLDGDTIGPRPPAPRR